MSYKPFTDAFTRSSGLSSGTMTVQKFGRNSAVGTAAVEHVWANGGAYNWLSGSSVLRIASGGDASDHATGAGARQITIEGLDENWDEATETLSTAGVAQSATTTTTFIRLNRAYVSQAGSYSGSNTAAIIIETTGDLVLANIEAQLGQTQLGHYSVPNGKTAYLANCRVRYASNKTSEVRLYSRYNADIVAAPFGPQRVLQTWSEFSGESVAIFDAMPVITQRSDIYFEVQAITSTGAIDVSFDLIVKDN